MESVVYWSFDDPNGLVLMEDTHQVGAVSLVAGMVNFLLCNQHMYIVSQSEK